MQYSDLHFHERLKEATLRLQASLRVDFRSMFIVDTYRCIKAWPLLQLAEDLFLTKNRNVRLWPNIAVQFWWLVHFLFSSIFSTTSIFVITQHFYFAQRSSISKLCLSMSVSISLWVSFSISLCLWTGYIVGFQMSCLDSFLRALAHISFSFLCTVLMTFNII